MTAKPARPTPEDLNAAFKAAFDIPEAPPKLPRCGKPRLVPLPLPFLSGLGLGLYLTGERCERSLGHGGRCCVYWENT